MKTAAVAGNVNYVVSKWAENAPDRFRESARYLGGLQLAQGFPEKASISTFGRGYAVVFWSAADLQEACRDAGALAALVQHRLETATRGLGKLFAQRLRGEGEDRSFVDAHGDALEQGIGYAISGLGGVAKLGDVLEHVGELPHIVDDDGIRVRRTEHVDGLQARLRFIARVVAPA